MLPIYLSEGCKVDITQTSGKCEGIRFGVVRDGKEVARAFLYVMHNDLHARPFGLLEDVFVDERSRGSGIGRDVVNEVIRVARERRCYKLIATSRHSRPRVHKLYERLGFANHGLEYRIDFDRARL